MDTASTRFRMLVTLPAAFLNSVGIGILNLGFLFVLKNEYRADPMLLGSFGALWSASYFVGCLALPGLSRRLSPRASMLAASICSAAFSALALVLRSQEWAFALNIAYGFCIALFWPPLMGWFTRGLEGKELGKATNDFSFAWSSGSIVAPWIAGLLAEALGSFSAIAVASGAFLLNGSFILFTLLRFRDGAKAAARPESLPDELSAEVPVAAASEGARPVETAEAKRAGTPLRYPAWIGVFALYVFSGLAFNIFPGFAEDAYGFNKDTIGFLLLLRAAITTFGFWFFGRFAFWHFKRRYLWLAPAAMAAVAAIAALVDVPGGLAFAFWGAALCLFGFLHASAYNASIFYGVSGTTAREHRMKIHETVLTAGQIAGSLMAGWLYASYSMDAALYGMAATLAVAAVAQAIFVYLRKREGKADKAV